MLEDLVKEHKEKFSESLKGEGTRGTMSCLMDDYIFFKQNFGEDGEDEWTKNEKIRIHKEEIKVDDFV